MSTGAEHRAQDLQDFAMRDQEKQRQAVQRLAARGMSDTTIAAATMLSVEQVRRLLAQTAT